jgi:hypothetical protein
MIMLKQLIKPDCLIMESQIKPDLNNITIFNQGLVDDGIYGYELKSPTSYLRYGYEPATKIFYLYNVATPKIENQHKGYAKQILEFFFQLIKKNDGTIDPGSYTTSGESYIKHMVERFSKQYGVRIVKGNRYE